MNLKEILKVTSSTLDVISVLYLNEFVFAREDLWIAVTILRLGQVLAEIADVKHCIYTEMHMIIQLKM